MRPNVRHLSVSNTIELSPNMRRITLTGDDLNDFPADMAGGYLKLLFPNTKDELKPIARTYTIAKQRSAKNEIDIDFMLHGDSGFASSWANKAKTGDTINIAGGAPKTPINHDAEWFLIAGDMTALPALTVNINELPTQAKGLAYIEILSEADKQKISKPTNFDIHWVINPKPGSEQTPLADAIINGPWLDGSASAWVACEFKTMKKIRAFLKKEKALQKQHLYISSYWKNGLIEEEHKKVKREDTVNFNS